MNRKDFKNKSEMQIFLSYFKPHRKLFFLASTDKILDLYGKICYTARNLIWCVKSVQTAILRQERGRESMEDS